MGSLLDKLSRNANTLGNMRLGWQSRHLDNLGWGLPNAFSLRIQEPSGLLRWHLRTCFSVFFFFWQLEILWPSVSPLACKNWASPFPHSHHTNHKTDLYKFFLSIIRQHWFKMIFLEFFPIWKHWFSMLIFLNYKVESRFSMALFFVFKSPLIKGRRSGIFHF